MNTISREQVLFSWALAEAYSPRWRSFMLDGLSQSLLNKLSRGEASEFTVREQDELIARLRVKRDDLISEFIDPANEFRIVALSAEMLEKAIILHTMSWQGHPILLGEYMDAHHDRTAPRDPRVAAAQHVATPPYGTYTGFPIIGHCQRLKCDMLVEGYSRSIGAILKARAGEAVPPLHVIYAS